MPVRALAKVDQAGRTSDRTGASGWGRRLRRLLSASLVGRSGTAVVAESAAMRRVGRTAMEGDS